MSGRGKGGKGLGKGGVRHRGILYITRHTLFLHAIRLGLVRHARSDQTRLQDHTEARMIRWRESTHPPTSPDTQTHPRDIIPDTATASHPIPSLRDFTTQHHIPRVASLTRTHTAGRSWYPPLWYKYLASIGFIFPPTTEFQS